MDYQAQARIQKQFRALVTAIRPSIIWTIDGVTQPRDLLDDDGIIGWQVGLGSIEAQLEGTTDPSLLALADWINREQELEKSRWKNPRFALAQARDVFGSKSWQTTRDQALLGCWLDNIDAALVRSPATHRSPLLSTQRYASHLSRLLKNEALADGVRNRLERITQLDPAQESREPILNDPRFVNRSDLAMLDCWLCSAPSQQAAAV